MDNDDDFTFCQVATPVDQDSVEANRVIPGVNNISIKDDCADGTSNHRSSGILWSDKLPSDPALEKHATAGSLTFKVIDASSQSSEPPKKAPVNVVGGSVKTSEQKNAVRKPASRAKVPYQIGYSPMDWQKLARKHPDLAGLKGQSNKRLIPLSEVKQHQTDDAMWTVLKGRVYNIAPYMKFHPGGVDMLMKAVGKDCTSLFNYYADVALFVLLMDGSDKYHAWVNAEFLLEKCLVGTLDDTK